MEAFQFFVTDDRYTVPSLMFVQARNIPAAQSLATRMLQNKHYCAVEVWAGEAKLFMVDRPLGDPPMRDHHGIWRTERP